MNKFQCNILDLIHCNNKMKWLMNQWKLFHQALNINFQSSLECKHWELSHLNSGNGTFSTTTCLLDVIVHTASERRGVASHIAECNTLALTFLAE